MSQILSPPIFHDREHGWYTKCSFGFADARALQKKSSSLTCFEIFIANSDNAEMKINVAKTRILLFVKKTRSDCFASLRNKIERRKV